jgi:hypothetical protein
MNLSIHTIHFPNNFYLYKWSSCCTWVFLCVPMGPLKMLQNFCRASLVNKSLSVAYRSASSLWNFLHNLVELLCCRDLVVRDSFVEAGYELGVLRTSEIQSLHTEIFPRKATIMWMNLKVKSWTKKLGGVLYIFGTINQRIL